MYTNGNLIEKLNFVKRSRIHAGPCFPYKCAPISSENRTHVEIQQKNEKQLKRVEGVIALRLYCQ